MTMETGPKILMGIGIILIIAGISWQFIPFGKLPGDIIYKKGGSTIYIPITTCILPKMAVMPLPSGMGI